MTPVLVDWKQWDSKLGRITDVALARQIGVSPTTVLRRRLRLNVPRFCILNQVLKKSRNLGKDLQAMSLSKLADKYGVSRSTMVRARESYGIKVPHNKRVTPQILKRLGTMSDVDLAKKFGISVSTVRFCRYRANIPAYRKEKP